MSVLIYPTGDPLLDELVEFAAARLPALHRPDMTRKASLAEEWWLEKRNGQPCPLKQGWSFLYRWARDRAVESGRASDGAADLLAHQLCVFLPTLFGKAREMATAQRAAA